MTKKIKQAEAVISYIENNGYITRDDASSKLGVANITAVISVIRKTRTVITKKIPCMSRYGKTSYTKYYLGD